MHALEQKQLPLSIPYPPEFVFKYHKNRMMPAQEIMNQQQAMFIFERIEYPESGGQLAYFKGVPYPAKGHPFPEAIYAVNTAKRMTMIALRLLTKWPRMKNFLQAYVDICTMFLPPYILTERYYSPCPMEVMMFIKTFLIGMKIDEILAMQVAETFGTLVEYDNAYRLRIEDVMSETTKEKLLNNPIKELKRLVQILFEREPHKIDATINDGNTGKFNQFVKILRYIYWIPSVKRAFKKAIEQSHFENFQYDEADHYHVLLWADYNFLGKSPEERIEIYKSFHKDGLPPRLVYKP